MAKRKKAKKTGSRPSRRRVSGIGDGFMPIIGGIAGVAAAGMIGKALAGKVDNKVLGLGLLAVGALVVPKMIKGPLGAGLAVGVGAAGGKTALEGFGVSIGSVSDFYRVPTINGLRRVNGSAQQMLSGVQLATESADVRRYRPNNYNSFTGANQLNVISGCPSEFDECGYGM